MEAKCPFCAAVFSTGRTGVQNCPQCGREVNVADVSGGGEPAAGVTPGIPGGPEPVRGEEPGAGPGPGFAGGRGPVAWERRGELGLLRAFFETWKEILLKPDDFWRRLRPDGSMGAALGFGWIATAIGALLQLPIDLLGQQNQAEQMRQARERLDDIPNLPPVAREWAERFAAQADSPSSALSGTIGSIIIYPLALVVGAAIIHVSALVFSAGKQGFNATFRIVAYAAAPAVLGIFGCLQALAGLYTVVLVIWGMTRVHQTSGGRATAAVLGPAVILCCCCGALFGTALLAFAKAASSGAVPTP